MQWNKKSASILAVLSLLLGSAGAIELQVHAQSPVLANSSAQIQTQSAAIGRPESASDQENGKETKDGIEANENLPDGGHQDQNGVNVDHQFEGAE
jgi:hypothetical protein